MFSFENLCKADYIHKSLADHAIMNGMAKDNAEKFACVNAATATLLAATWKRMIMTSPFLTKVLTDVDIEDNLCALIDYCSTLDAKIVAKMVAGVEKEELSRQLGNEPIKRVRTILLYPKRLALLEADWLERDAIAKMKARITYNPRFRSDDSDKLRGTVLDFLPAGSYLANLIEAVAKEYLPEVLPDWDYFSLNPDPYVFSHGAVSDACTNPVCKWARADLFREEADSEWIPVPDPVLGRNREEEVIRLFYDGPHYASREKRSSGYNVTLTNLERKLFQRRCVEWNMSTHYSGPRYNPRYVVSPITVPKQFTSVRTIAMEDSWHARIQSHLSKQLRKYWKLRHVPYFLYDNQEKQRQIALAASKSGKFATVDLSAASDTVYRQVLLDFNHRSIRELLNYMPSHVRFGENIWPMTMFGTMGSPLTFDMEMIFFYIMCRVAWVLANLGKKKSRVFHVWIVGDDIIIDQYIADTLIDLLKRVGCEPNEKKTFINGSFREACGVEAFNGEDVTPTLWPRGLTIQSYDSDRLTHYDFWKSETTSTLSSLISIANELEDSDFKDAASHVRAFIADNYSNKRELLVDPGHNPGFVWGDSVKHAFVSMDGKSEKKIRWSPFDDADITERPKATRVAVRYVTLPSKSTCWCYNMSESVYNALVATYNRNVFYMHGPAYEDDLLSELQVSMQRDVKPHMRPVHYLVEDAIS